MRAFITGVNGYIGRHLAARLLDGGNEVAGLGRGGEPFDPRVRYYRADITDARALQSALEGERPEAVFHLAALVHEAGRGKPWLEWERVNVWASEQLAMLSRACGVRWFMLMSSVAVYDSVPRSLKREVRITAETPVDPKTDYGRSKLMAERAVAKLETADFAVCTARPPMVYGKNCPGNYAALRSLALRFGVIPAIGNRHSVLHIDGLSSFLVQCMEDGVRGLHFPQDESTACTAAMMRRICEINGRGAHTSKLAALAVRMGAPFLPPLRKAFGSVTIDEALSGGEGACGDFGARMERAEPW